MMKRYRLKKDKVKVGDIVTLDDLEPIEEEIPSLELKLGEAKCLWRDKPIEEKKIDFQALSKAILDMVERMKKYQADGEKTDLQVLSEWLWKKYKIWIGAVEHREEAEIVPPPWIRYLAEVLLGAELDVGKIRIKK